MGKYTSMKKVWLLKALAGLCIMATIFLFAPNQKLLAYSGLAQNESVETYEKIMSTAFDESNPFILDLRQLDLANLRKTYHQLSESEREKVTEFPFFEEEAFEFILNWLQNPENPEIFFIYNIPPEMKQIKPDIWENWKKTKHVSLEIDNEIQESSILEKFNPEDFVLFEVKETKAKGFLKKPEYLLKLTSPEYYQEKYIRPRKEVRSIWVSEEAGFNSMDSMKVLFAFSRGSEKNNGINEFIPSLKILKENLTKLG
jgi:hypothetical protein